jgi:glycosyltransferase involved in cell wall biosynthesis
MATVSSSVRKRPHDAVATIAARSFTPRRILQVITPSHMSGAETQVLRVTRRMRERGHVMPILVKRGSSAVAEMQNRGFDVETARIGGKINVLAIPTLARAARRHGADIVQSNLSTASWWCGWLESLGGPKSVGHVHGFTSARWHNRQSHLLAVSGAVRDDLIAHGIPGDRITVLWNALDADEFRPSRDPLAVRAEFGADAATPVIGTFGHLSIKKGHRELFAAMPRVIAKFPNAQFWIIGQGDLRDELERTARAGGYLDNVRLAGYRRDAADVMNALDVFGLPSHREPCALVYVEAALLKKPIVACRAGGAPESIADGETGILVPPCEATGAGIADALLMLLENRDVAARMGQAGHDRAREPFNWPRYIATLEGVYEKVLG